MPRELALFDALVPTLLLILIASSIVYIVLAQLFQDVALADYVWHPALFQFAIFVILFSSLGLWWYS